MTLRTIGVAVTVTVIDLVIALPIAFYMAKVARRGARRAARGGVMMPLWAGYLVKALRVAGRSSTRRAAC